MAEITATILQTSVEGDVTVVYVSVTAGVNNADVYTKHGLSNILFASFIPAISGVTHGVTISGTTLTFAIAGGAPTGLLRLEGTGR